LKYSVPNAPDVLYLDQAEPDDFDYQALGFRRTGVTSGGDVTALGTPGASVQVASGIAVIGDDPVRFTGGTVAVANGGGNPRFDIIAVSKTGALTNIPGAASANALFADFDFANYCPLASVYVPAGSTSVLGSHISLKTAAMPNRFSRTYNHPGTTFLFSEVTGASPSTYTVTAEGEHYWSSSTLKRLTTYTMQWVTSLVMKAVGVDSGRTILILQSTDTIPWQQKLIQTQSSSGQETAFINGAGQAYFDNFKYGQGNPNGAIVGDKGDIFVSRNNGGTNLGIWQKGGANNTKTDWESLRIYKDNESSLPTGSLIYSLAASAPSGFIAPIGQWISTSGETADLAAMIGSRYGSQPGQVMMPNLRGRTLACFGSGDSPEFTDKGQDQMQLTVANLPAHNHGVNDPGHAHPQAGPYAYVMPWQFHNNRHPVPSDSALEHIYTEASTFDKHARTGITINNRGGDEPFSLYQPTHFVHLYVKL
jgi:microcystin-dependent protein